jgi:hypothetical protein
MKKTSILLVFNLLFFMACHKPAPSFPECSDADRILDLNLQPQDAFYFSSGLDLFPEPIYKMQNGKLWFLRAKGTRDTFVQLSNDLFLQSKRLMEVFPKQLKDTPFLFSKGNCSNPHVYRFEVHYNKGQQQSWFIEHCGDDTLYPPTLCYLKQIDFISNLLPK